MAARRTKLFVFSPAFPPDRGPWKHIVAESAKRKYKLAGSAEYLGETSRMSAVCILASFTQIPQ